MSGFPLCGPRQNWNMPLISRQCWIFYHIKKKQILKVVLFHPCSADHQYCQAGGRKKILKKEVMVLGPGVKTGLNIMMDNPGQLGADLVANAVAGLNEYPVPFIVIDMGTATTVSVVNDKKQYIGGMIMPGVGVSLDALTARASQLSGISIDAPKHVLGKNTIECMKSGVLYSNAAAIDGIVDRVEEELGEKATVIATGGLAKKIVSHCKKEIILDEDLLLKGLLVIYEKNK